MPRDREVSSKVVCFHGPEDINKYLRESDGSVESLIVLTGSSRAYSYIVAIKGYHPQNEEE